MSPFVFSGLPSWAMPVSLAVHFAAGAALGIFYFRNVWWTAGRFASGGRVTTTIAAIVGRFVLLGGVLTLASLEGPLPLLVMALGVIVARTAVMRSVRKAEP
jgi:F1F0 ATPase subunit 2